MSYKFTDKLGFQMLYSTSNYMPLSFYHIYPKYLVILTTFNYWLYLSLN